MATPQNGPVCVVGKLLVEQDGDVLREGIRVLSQALMERKLPGSLARTGTSARWNGPVTATATGCGPGHAGWHEEAGHPKVRPGTCSHAAAATPARR